MRRRLVDDAIRKIDHMESSSVAMCRRPRKTKGENITKELEVNVLVTDVTM